MINLFVRVSFYNLVLIIHAQICSTGTVLGAWIQSGLPGVVDPDKLVHHIEGKSKRPNNTRGGRAREPSPDGEAFDLNSA